MIRIVLDSNVLVSGSISVSGTIVELLDAWTAQQIVVALSAPILIEVERTLGEPYFIARIGQRRVQQYLSRIYRRAELVEVAGVVTGAATHPADDLILATAVAGNVDYLVTGDRQLLALGEYDGIQIVSPATFMDILRSQDMTLP